MEFSGTKRQEYTNVPMNESSFLSSGSITSRTPLTHYDSPPESPIRDPSQENHYETPVDFEIMRVRHEEDMIAQRELHRKKQSPLYELSKCNGVNTQTRQYSDEVSDVKYVRRNDMRCRWSCAAFSVLILIALGASGFSCYKVLMMETKSQSSPEGPVSGGNVSVCLKSFACILSPVEC